MNLDVLPQVLANLERQIAAFEKDAAPLAAQVIREHIAREYANERNALGAALLPYGNKWAFVKRESGLRLNRGQAAGGILSALRSARSVQRVSDFESLINPELANATSPYPRALGGAKHVNKYMGHYNRKKAGGSLMDVSEPAARAAEAVLDKHLDALLERI